MGTATTFAGLIANPESEKVFLAELKLAELLQGWSAAAAVSLGSKAALGSYVDGTAFIDNIGNLTGYENWYLEATDGAGKKAGGYVKAIGTGLTKGPNLLTNGAFTNWTGDDPDNFTLGFVEDANNYVTENPAGKCKMVADGTKEVLIREGNYGSGQIAQRTLYYVSVDVDALSISAGGFSLRELGVGAIINITSTGAKEAYYITSYAGGSSPIPLTAQSNSTASVYDVTIDNLNIQKVTAPSNQGVTIVSTREGSTYNWASIDAGFDFDATSLIITLTPPLTFQKSYLNETVTLADSTTEIIRKVISAMEEDGTAYTEKTSVVEVEATASTFYHDTTNGILYAHASDGGTPDDFTIIGYFWLYFATKGIILDSRYYEPYIADRGIPKISQSTPDIHWGISKISSGSIVFLNGRGFFDQIARNFIWHNKKARILLGGDSLSYSEYSTIFTGRIVDTNFSSREFLIELRSNSFDLLRDLPINDFWTSNYPNLDPSAEGRPIPVFYGVYDASQAPVVTCIDTAYAASTYQFKIADHPIKSITQVYVDYGDGVGWQTIGHANEDLTNATFTINTASFVVGTSRVKVAFEGYHVASVLTEGAPEIAESILTNLCGYAAGDLNAASFAASKAISDCALNVPIENVTSALTIIETICKSDLAFFDEDEDGLLRYRTWEPSVTGTVPVLTSTDIMDDKIPSVQDDTSKLFWKVKVSYGYQCAIEESLYAEEGTAASKYKYSKNEVLIHDTYLRTSADAAILAGRLNWLTRDPSPTLILSLKAAQIDKLLGDKIKVTLARAPYGAAGGYVERVFELIGKDLSCFPVRMALTGRDLMDFGNNVGFWMADDAPDWATATAQERDDSGFWCDDNGYAVTGDETTKNKSLWW